MISFDENGELYPWNICQDNIDIIAKYPQADNIKIVKAAAEEDSEVRDEDAVNLDDGVIQQAGV